MVRRAIYIPLLVLFMMALSLTLTSCMGVGVGGRWETKSSEEYRDYGTAISNVADSVQDFCRKETVTETCCQDRRDMYNQMRQNYILAGNTLRDSIILGVDNAYYKSKYEKEMKQVTKDIRFILKSIGGYHGVNTNSNND